MLRLSPLFTGVRVVLSLCTGFTRLRGERGLYLIPIIHILVNVSSGKNSSDPLFLFQRPVELDLNFYVWPDRLTVQEPGQTQRCYTTLNNVNRCTHRKLSLSFSVIQPLPPPWPLHDTKLWSHPVTHHPSLSHPLCPRPTLTTANCPTIITAHFPPCRYALGQFSA